MEGFELLEKFIKFSQTGFDSFIEYNCHCGNQRLDQQEGRTPAAKHDRGMCVAYELNTGNIGNGRGFPIREKDDFCVFVCKPACDIDGDFSESLMRQCKEHIIGANIGKLMRKCSDVWLYKIDILAQIGRKQMEIVCQCLRRRRPRDK